MDTERLYRRSMPGIFFVGVLFFSYLLFGGDSSYVVNSINNENYSFLIAILVTTPIIGFIISSITISIFHKCQGHKFYINNPPSTKIKEVILNSDHRLFTNVEKLSKPELQEFYCIYQVYIRISLNSESLRFLERRWNFYWIHINNIAAIFLGLLFSAFLNYKDSNTPIKPKCWLLTGIAIGIFAYLIVAIYQSCFLKKEILQLEEEAVIRSKKKEILPEKKSKKTK